MSVNCEKLVWPSGGTVIETVPEALSSMMRLFEQALGWRVPSWLEQADSLWSTCAAQTQAARRVVVPIWREPWMAFHTSPTRLVDGRLITWYGPSLVEAADWQP